MLRSWRLRVFENLVLRKVLGPKEVGGNRIMRNYAVGTVDCIFFATLGSRRMVGHASCVGYMRSAFKIFVVKYAGKRFLSMRDHDSKDNINLYLRERGCDVAWIHLAECRD
jgi:hypothetical protein